MVYFLGIKVIFPYIFLFENHSFYFRIGKIMLMIERFLKQTEFASMEDFKKNFKLKIPKNFNFAYDVMDAWAEEAPDKPALLWCNDKGMSRQTTFLDLKEQTDRAAAYFQFLGIGRGDMVMIMLKRRYEFWITILALHKIGAIAIPATHLLTDLDIIYRIERATIRAIICAGDDYILKHIQDAVYRCGGVGRTVRTLISVGPIVPEGFHDFQKEWLSAPAFHRPQQVNTNDDTMLMYFTSGTSGEPKMVAHDYLYALGHLITGVYWHNLGPDSIHLTIADTGWGKAAWGKLYGQWLAGATVFVYDHEKFNADEMLRMIGKYRITSLCAPPTIFRFLIKEDLEKYDLSSLKYLCTAGEALNGSVYQTMLEKTGLKIHEAFGQTETTLTLGTFPWMEPKPGSMGKPSPLYDIVLLNPDGSKTRRGEVGEICIRTLRKKPCGLFKGYWRDDEKTAYIWHDGYYHSCDMAWKDKDGYYWFVGRNDDIIKSSGYRVSPFEVESVLMMHPSVLECAVTGVPDEVRGFVVKATIVLTKAYKDKAGESLAKEIQTFVKNTTAPYKYPRIIEFVDELPKTISGKIRRTEIRANHSASKNHLSTGRRKK